MNAPVLKFEVETTHDAEVRAALDVIDGVRFSSENRIYPILRFMAQSSKDVAMDIFSRTWTSCDDTWPVTTHLVNTLLRVGDGVDFTKFLLAEDAEWFASLEENVTIYRGGSDYRAWGASWTTSRMVAESFARGHRGYEVFYPVISTAVIPKDLILFASNDRGEQDIVVNPRRLRKRVVESYISEAIG